MFNSFTLFCIQLIEKDKAGFQAMLISAAVTFYTLQLYAPMHIIELLVGIFNTIQCTIGSLDVNHKMLATNNTSFFNPLMFLAATLNGAVWAFYGYTQNSFPMMFANTTGVALAVLTFIVYFKVRGYLPLGGLFVLPAVLLDSIYGLIVGKGAKLKDS